MDILKGAEFQVVHIDTTGTSLSTDTTSLSLVDMQGFESLLYIGVINTLTAAGNVGIEDYEASSSGGTYYAMDTDYAGAYQITTTTGSNKSLVLLNINKPLRRWHSIRVHKGTQPCNMDVVAVKYNPKGAPVTNSTENYHVAASESVVSPTSDM